MSAYNIEKNYDDVALRYIIVALLAELRDKIYFFDTYESGKKKVSVPFYFSLSGNEDFLIENFLHDSVTDPNNIKAIGNYEVVPRGVLGFPSVSIDSGEMTHKFIRTQLVREIEGKLKTFSFETNFIPVTLQFEVSIQCNSALERFKITQSLISKLYKNNLFEIDMGGYRISGNFSIPEDLDQEQLMEFSFSDKKEYKINFSIEVKTFIPVFEHGLLMGDIEEFIDYLIEHSDKSTDEILQGVGVFRGGQNNKQGIYFGNIIEQFKSGLSDLQSAPYNDDFSNIRYKAIGPGPTQLITSTRNIPEIPGEIPANHSRLILDDGTNPHGTTKIDIELGNVPNLDTTDSVANQHTHSNKSILDQITHAFTTNLKNLYDGAVTWIQTNGQNILDHLINTNNPHNVTKEQIGLDNVDNTSDLDKPISNLTQFALNSKANDADISLAGKTNNYNDLNNLPVIPSDLNQLTDINNLLFDGDYNSLINLPTLFSGSYNDLSDLPTLFDGDYNSLINLPVIPSDLNQLTDINNLLFDGDYNSLINLPTLFSGSYNDLSDLPILFDGQYSSLTGTPLNLSDFINDLGFITCNNLTDCRVIATIQSDLIDIQDNMLTCNNLTDCKVIYNLLTERIWTLDFMEGELEFILYAPYDLIIFSVTNIVNTPTTTILVNGSAYTFQDPIDLGDEITITVSTESVINLTTSQIITI